MLFGLRLVNGSISRTVYYAVNSVGIYKFIYCRLVCNVKFVPVGIEENMLRIIRLKQPDFAAKLAVAARYEYGFVLYCFTVMRGYGRCIYSHELLKNLDKHQPQEPMTVEP